MIRALSCKRFIVACLSLLVGSGSVAMADDREDAVEFLKATLQCPVGAESSTSKDGWFKARKTRNEFLGNASAFKLREHYTLTEGQVGGEAYETENYTDVSFSYPDIKSFKISNSKLTVSCTSSRSCIKILYVSNPDEELQEIAMAKDPMDCFHAGMCRIETRKSKSSYRISLCNASAAKDLKEAIEFLSQ